MNRHRSCLNSKRLASVDVTEKAYTAVLGNGMLRNNILLPALLNKPVKRWYPWHRVTKHNKFIPYKSALTDTYLPQLPSEFAGWGKKKSFSRAKKLANKLNRPVLSVEDGFLRSITSGIKSRYGCSIVIDDVGIYFDSFETSKLEHDIVSRLLDWNKGHQERAERAINQIIDYRLSKYNSVLECPNLSDLLKESYQRKCTFNHVLVVDQVKGDASIKGAGAGNSQFQAMLNRALKNHPKSHIWIKAHPASKLGYLNDPKILKNFSISDQKRIHILQSAVNPISLIKQVDHVYTVSSHMGFEALLLNKTVHCFGVSWYSGWGLTDDKYAPKKLLKRVIKRRECLFKTSAIKQSSSVINNKYDKKSNHKSSVVEASVLPVFYAAYIDYSRYADPASGQPCQLEQVIEWLSTNRYWYLRLPSKMTVYQFSRWKTPFVTHFLHLINSRDNASIQLKPKPRFPLFQLTNRIKVDLTHDILVWGLATKQKIEHNIQKLPKSAENLPNIWCMEDGFIRSNGLGATLLEPLSVVIDDLGIYYDATQASDLECLIATCPELNQLQLERVRALHEKLLIERVSKYHVGQPAKIKIPTEIQDNASPIILVVGQVEDDLSVQYCGSVIRTNSALIERVRLDNPEAYLIFKPHPDVEAGLRAGGVSSKTLKLVNDVVRDVAMPDCLEVVDEVHTISSLTGFEALLRHKKVSCYGLPFYAGWGLTNDMDTSLRPKLDFLKRRQQKRYEFLETQVDGLPREQFGLSIEQLIYCTLICYPMYRLPGGYGLAQVEQVIDYLYSNAKSIPNPTGCLKPLVQLKPDKNESQIMIIHPNAFRKTFTDLNVLAMDYENKIRLAKTKFMKIRHNVLQKFSKK